MTTPPSGTRATTRVAIATLPLLALWAVGFNELTPFYPTILVGAAAMVGLSVWVWRSPDAVRFPAFTVSAAHVGLAAAVAVTHYLVGLGLFWVAARTVPAIAETAASAYDQAGTVSLWLAVLFGGIVSAPLEEVFWRGAFQPVVTRLAARRSPLAGRQPFVGIGVTAIGYALFHAATLQLALVAAAALGGLVWGWLLERTRSLGAVMIAHGLWTTFMLLAPPA